jgi:hypothetical protein
MERFMTRANKTSRRFPGALGIRLLFVLLAIWLLCGQGPGAGAAWAQSAASKEYQIKAACLLNFLRFIEWPAASFPNAQAPFIVGVLGDDPFGKILEQTFQDESIGGRSIVVKRSRQVDELKSCHLLFVAKSEQHRLPEILASLGEASTVTVGDIDGFARTGGIINFYIESGKIRFEINADSAQHKGLRISSQLLKRARIVTSDQSKGRQ